MEEETDESNESDPIFTIYVLHMYIIYTYNADTRGDSAEYKYLNTKSVKFKCKL